MEKVGLISEEVTFLRGVEKKEGIILLRGREDWKGSSGGRECCFLVQLQENQGGDSAVLFFLGGENCNVAHYMDNIRKALLNKEGHSDCWYTRGAYPEYGGSESLYILRGEALRRVIEGPGGLLNVQKVSSVKELASSTFYDVEEVDEEGNQNFSTLSVNAIKAYYGEEFLAKLQVDGKFGGDINGTTVYVTPAKSYRIYD